MEHPMVSVIVLTYNQEGLIHQCVESILSQKTQFPFEIILGEDMGSDQTREICRQYTVKDERIILPDRDRNLGVSLNWLSCVQQAKGKYIMSLGGDDFWHNPGKIQMQIDFMEENPKCAICFTDYDILYTKFNKTIHSVMRTQGICPPEGMIQKDVFDGRAPINAGTMCIRKDLIDKYISYNLFEKGHFPCEDFPTTVILSAYGEIRYLPVSTWTYRVGHESIMNMKNYDRIRKFWEDNSSMNRVLHELFPKELGSYNDDEPYFTSQVNHALLIAAYENNDFKSARTFAISDPQKGIAAKMTNNIITFKLYKSWRVMKSFLIWLKHSAFNKVN